MSFILFQSLVNRYETLSFYCTLLIASANNEATFKITTNRQYFYFSGLFLVCFLRNGVSDNNLCNL